MARRSLMDRYEQLDERRAEMDAELMGRVQPTAVHTAMIDVLSNLLSMGNQFATDKVPAPLRAMMRTLEMMKPTLVEELARIPADQIQVFMEGLRDELDRIVQAPAGEAAPAPAHLVEEIVEEADAATTEEAPA